jgi:leucyl/phenylalanyl-tRNA--protein transferase
MTIRLPRLGRDPDSPFPPVEQALREPDGLLAFGGDLHPRRLLGAYRRGIFPWYSAGEPILWWSPDPRTVFRTSAFDLPRRFRRLLRGSNWQITADLDFAAVVAACADIPRRGQRGTWITGEMRAGYESLHRLGHAHSIEVRGDGRLLGGIYGVVAGGVFCGESMFSVESGASKVALAALCRTLAAWGVALLDAQVANPHLSLLGATTLERARYLEYLELPTPALAAPGPWTERFGIQRACELA